MRATASAIGQTLITFGMVVLLFCAYELWVTGIVTAREQNELDRELTRSWSQAAVPLAAAVPPAAARLPAAAGPPAAAPSAGSPAGAAPGRPSVAAAPVPPATAAAPAPAPAAPAPAGPVPAAPAPSVPQGSAMARLYLPSLQGDRPLVLIEGVGVADLKKGPGHLPGSAQPGEIGNSVVSGHRTTYGAPFGDLDRLEPGDAVVVQTRDAWVTYRITGTQVVDPSAVQVTFPVPGQARAVPTRRLLTLTTCHPEYSARERLIVRGELEASTSMSAGPPAALAG